MATLGFLRRDFDVFAIDDFSVRLAKIDQLVTPRLMQLAPGFQPGIVAQPQCGSPSALRPPYAPRGESSR